MPPPPSRPSSRPLPSHSWPSLLSWLTLEQGLALHRGPVGESDRTRLLGKDGEEVYAQVSLEEAIEAVAGDVTLTCDECPLTARFDGANVTWLPCSGQNVTVEFGSAGGDVPLAARLAQ